MPWLARCMGPEQRGGGERALSGRGAQVAENTQLLVRIHANIQKINHQMQHMEARARLRAAMLAGVIRGLSVDELQDDLHGHHQHGGAYEADVCQQA